MPGEPLNRLSLPRVLASWFVATVVVAVAGPFGTYGTVPLGLRLVQWGVVLGLALLSGVVSTAVVRRFCWHMARARRAVVQALVYLSVLLPVLFLSMSLLQCRLLPNGPNLLAAVAFALMVPLGALAMRLLWPAPLAADGRAGPDGSGARPEEGHAAPQGAPRLMARLDPEVRGAVLHLSVRDHYVDVLTDQGRASLLMRFSDAMAEVEGVEGLQVHRSHWVARAAVAGCERAQGRVFLCLCEGSRVPVSRGCLPAVVAAGWIPG